MTDRVKPIIPFVNLHAHSVAGSPYDALGYPAEHMDYAWANGLPAMALTDHGNCNGLALQVAHAKKMNKSGRDFKAIYGVEAYFLPSIADWREDYKAATAGKKKTKKDDGAGEAEDEAASKGKKKNKLRRTRHLLVLAQNQKGLQNLFKLVSASHKDEAFYAYPRMDFEMLKEHNEGLIVSSACLGGVLSGCMWENLESGEEAMLQSMRDLVVKFIDIFGDRFYGELQWNNIPEQQILNTLIIKLHDELGLPLISTVDSHYSAPEKWRDRLLYNALRPNKKHVDNFQLPESINEVGYELYPKNGDQMWDAYQVASERTGAIYDSDVVRESIEKAHEVAFNRIERFWPDNTIRLPDFVVPVGKTADEALMTFALKGLTDKGLHTKKEYVERLKEELSIIEDRKFSKYFLTTKAIVDRIKEEQLIGVGRGSGPGSLVSYVLGFSELDPIKYKLQFSRFLRRDATDYPDTDIDWENPMEAKEILVNEWGEDRVIPVSNFNTLKPKSAIKDVARLLDLPFFKVNAITKKMDFEAISKAKEEKGITAGAYEPNLKEYKKYSDSYLRFIEENPEVHQFAEVVAGQRKATGRHAGGLVIGEQLNEWMPLIRSKGVIQTPYAKEELESMGFIKFDELGLDTLKMFRGAIKRILKRHYGVINPAFHQIRSYYENTLSPENLDLEDQAVWENIFQKGRFLGTFQFTSDGAAKFCVQIEPNRIIDLSIVTSTYRPGPISAGVHEGLLARRRCPESIDYAHPIVREVTEETSGYLVFQEQIALLAHKLGRDISLDEGNLLRKILVKKKLDQVKQAKLDDIKLRFIEGCINKGMLELSAEELWQSFKYFLGYGFNLSHATAYSIISYQCAWLLHYYPIEWCAAFLDHTKDNDREKHISLVREHGFKIQTVHINKSSNEWEIAADGQTLIQPFVAIKGCGDTAVDEIINNRPFNTIEELLFNEDIRYNKLNKRVLHALCCAGGLDNLIDGRFEGDKHFWSACVHDRPKTEKKLLENIEKYLGMGSFTEEERIQFSIDLSGIYPLHLVLPEAIHALLEEKEIPPVSDYDEELGVCWGIPKAVLVKKTKKGRDYYEVHLTDTNFGTSKIRCWGIRLDMDRIELHKPYVILPNYNEKWGLSSSGPTNKKWRLLV